MGVKEIIGGITLIGSTATYLKETIPKYFLKEPPKDSLGLGLWALTNVATSGIIGFTLYKMATHKNE